MICGKTSGAGLPILQSNDNAAQIPVFCNSGQRVMFVLKTRRGRLAVVTGALSLASVAVWFADWPRPQAEIAEPLTISASPDLDPDTIEWCFHKVRFNLDNPDETIWLAAKITQVDDPPPAPWLIDLVASYRAPNRHGALQKFKVEASFSDDESPGKTGLRLIRIRHYPGLPGVDFVEAL